MIGISVVMKSGKKYEFDVYTSYQQILKEVNKCKFLLLDEYMFNTSEIEYIVKID